MVAALAVDVLVTERHLVYGTCVYMYQRRRDALCLFGLQWPAHMIRVSHTGVFISPATQTALSAFAYVHFDRIRACRLSSV